MKRTFVQIILKPEFALAAGLARLNNDKDPEVNSVEQAHAYRGSEFHEDTEGCKELHIVYVGGMACVNFLNEDNIRINYDYPIDTLARIKTY